MALMSDKQILLAETLRKKGCQNASKVIVTFRMYCNIGEHSSHQSERYSCTGKIYGWGMPGAQIHKYFMAYVHGKQSKAKLFKRPVRCFEVLQY